MDVDIAVLGGGPGGYTAAIRAAQLGASVACIEKEPELGGTCLRVGCIPTKAWVQTAWSLKEAHETFGKLGVQVGEPQLDLATANEWKAGVVKQMTSGVAVALQGERRRVGQGRRPLQGREHDRGRGRRGRHLQVGGRRHGLVPAAPADRRASTPRCCVDSTGLLAQEQVPGRLVVLGGGIIGCEFASIFSRFGSRGDDHRDARVADPAGGRGRLEGAREAVRRRGISLELGKQCSRVEESGGSLTVHYGDGETVEADLMLVAVGRGPLVEGLGLEDIGVEFDRRKGIAADEHRRTTVPHIYAVGDCAGYWQLAHTAFREGEVAAENAMGHDAIVDNRGVPRPIYTDPEIAAVGLTEAEAREQYGDDVAVGQFPWVANARAVMQNDTVGWVKSIHETRYGEFLGLVMVGPHVTDMVEAGVVALDAEATVETIADGMAPHPTLSEAIKEAGLVALGRPIHIPAKRRAASTT